MSVFQQRELFAVLLSKPTFPGSPEVQEENLARLKKLLEQDVVAIYDVCDGFEKLKSQEVEGSRHWDKTNIVPLKIYPVFEFNETPGLEIQEAVAQTLIGVGLFDLLFIEPNENYAEAKRAWLCRNVELKSFQSVLAARVRNSRIRANNPTCRLTLEVGSYATNSAAKEVARVLLKQVSGDPISMGTPITVF